MEIISNNNKQEWARTLDREPIHKSRKLGSLSLIIKSHKNLKKLKVFWITKNQGNHRWPRLFREEEFRAIDSTRICFANSRTSKDFNSMIKY